MNKKALNDSYTLFKSKGYTKSIDDYVKLINSNEKALNDSYNLFKSKGYTKSIDDFKVLLGVGEGMTSTQQKPEVEETTPTAKTPSQEDQYAAMSEALMQGAVPKQSKTTPQDTGATAEEVQAPVTESKLEDGSLGSQEEYIESDTAIADFYIKDGKKIPLTIEEYKDITFIDKDFDKTLGDSYIIKGPGLGDEGVMYNKKEIIEAANQYNVSPSSYLQSFINNPKYGVSVKQGGQTGGLEVPEVTVSSKAPELTRTETYTEYVDTGRGTIPVERTKTISINDEVDKYKSDVLGPIDNEIIRKQDEINALLNETYESESESESKKISERVDELYVEKESLNQKRDKELGYFMRKYDEAEQEVVGNLLQYDSSSNIDKALALKAKLDLKRKTISDFRDNNNVELLVNQVKSFNSQLLNIEQKIKSATSESEAMVLLDEFMDIYNSPSYNNIYNKLNAIGRLRDELIKDSTELMSMTDDVNLDENIKKAAATDYRKSSMALRDVDRFLGKTVIGLSVITPSASIEREDALEEEITSAFDERWKNVAQPLNLDDFKSGKASFGDYIGEVLASNAASTVGSVMMYALPGGQVIAPTIFGLSQVGQKKSDLKYYNRMIGAQIEHLTKSLENPENADNKDQIISEIEKLEMLKHTDSDIFYSAVMSGVIEGGITRLAGALGTGQLKVPGVGKLFEGTKIGKAFYDPSKLKLLKKGGGMTLGELSEEYPIAYMDKTLVDNLWLGQGRSFDKILQDISDITTWDMTANILINSGGSGLAFGSISAMSPLVNNAIENARRKEQFGKLMNYKNILNDRSLDYGQRMEADKEYKKLLSEISINEQNAWAKMLSLSSEEFQEVYDLTYKKAQVKNKVTELTRKQITQGDKVQNKNVQSILTDLNKEYNSYNDRIAKLTSQEDADLNAKDFLLMANYKAALGVSKAKSGRSFFKMGDNYMGLVNAANDIAKKIENNDSVDAETLNKLADKFIFQLQNDESFNNLPEKSRIEFIESIRKDPNTALEILTANANANYGLTFVNDYKIRSVLKDENMSDLDKSLAATSPKHEIGHHWMTMKNIENMDEAIVDAAYNELKARIEYKIFNRKDTRVNNERLNTEIQERLKQYDEITRGDKRLRFEELMNLYTDLNSIGYINDSDIDSSFRFKDLFRIGQKELFGELNNASENSDINKSTINHLRSFERFWKSKNKLSGGLSRGNGNLLSISEKRSMYDRMFRNGELDMDQYTEAIMNLADEQEKSPSSWKSVFSEAQETMDLENKPEILNRPKVRKALKQLIEYNAKDVMGAAKISEYEKESFIDDVIDGWGGKTGLAHRLKTYDPSLKKLNGYLTDKVRQEALNLANSTKYKKEQYNVRTDDYEAGYDIAYQDNFDEAFDHVLFDEGDVLIDPISIFKDKKFESKASAEVRSKFNTSEKAKMFFGDTSNLVTESLSEKFQIREERFLKETGQLNADELNSSAKIIFDAAEDIYNILPDANYVLDPASAEGRGISVNMKRLLMDKFYEVDLTRPEVNPSTGRLKREFEEGVAKTGKKVTGASSGIVKFKKEFNKSEFLSMLGINEDGTNNSLRGKSDEANLRLATLRQIGKLITNTEGRKIMEEMGIPAQMIVDFGAGRSKNMLSTGKTFTRPKFNVIDSELNITEENIKETIESLDSDEDLYRYGNYMMSQIMNDEELSDTFFKMVLKLYELRATRSKASTLLMMHPGIKGVFNKKGVDAKSVLKGLAEIYKNKKDSRILSEYSQKAYDAISNLINNDNLTKDIAKYVFHYDADNRSKVSPGKFNISDRTKRYANNTRSEFDKLESVDNKLFFSNLLSSEINAYLRRTVGQDYETRLKFVEGIIEKSKKYNSLKLNIRNTIISGLNDMLSDPSLTKEQYSEAVAYTTYSLINTGAGTKNLVEISKNHSMISENTLIRGDKSTISINEKKKQDPNARHRAYVQIEHAVTTSSYDVQAAMSAITGKMPSSNYRYRGGIVDSYYARDIDSRGVRLIMNGVKNIDVDYKTHLTGRRYKELRTVAEKDGARIFSASKAFTQENGLGSNPESKTDRANLEYVTANILKKATGISIDEQISESTARLNSDRRKKKFRFMSPSAEDFTGFWYSFLGKGKEGDAQKAFFEKYLTEPLNRAYVAMTHARQKITRDFKDLNREYEDVKVSMPKSSGYLKYTNDQALRAYLYLKSGNTNSLLGISEADAKALNDIVLSNPRMLEYATYLQELTGTTDSWVGPKSKWTFGSIFEDVERIIDDVKRAEYISEWKKNADAIFSSDNMNKIESHYGTDFRNALEDMLYRIEKGKAIPEKTTKEMSEFQKWLTGSVAVTMFFNAKSAVLQLMSITNYINWSDNNPIQAAKAFANIPQFSKDVVKIFNSDYLKERRGGLKTEVEAAVLANELRKGGVDGYRGFINKLLQKGFTFTQIGDSLAISFGGASFYRNRKNAYIKQGISEQQAHDKAWLDFIETTEQSQQSARPDKLSMQQTTTVGRIFLAFQNTPMQYYRLTTRAAQDLAAGRGDRREHISKIAYYSFAQSAIFSALQQSLFAFLGDAPEDEEKKDKYEAEKEKRVIRTINSVLDTMLRGSGLRGAYVATVKNAMIEFVGQEKKGYKADHARTLIEVLNLSAPVGIKARTLYQGAYMNYKYNKDIVEDMGFDIDNPGYDIVGSLLSAGVNIPMDKVINDIRQLKEAADSDNDAWQRVALALGWSTWNLGIENEKIEELKAQKTKEKKEAAKEKRRKESSGWGKSNKSGW